MRAPSERASSHRHPRELPLAHLQQVDAGRQLRIRVRYPLALDADSALRDQPPRLRSRRGQPELRQGLRQRNRLCAGIASDLALLDALGNFTPLVDELELLLGGARRGRAVVTRDDLLGQLALRLARVVAAQRIDL